MENKRNKLILYKYISFAKFIDLVELERLYLTNIKLWDDTHEGAVLVENFGYGMSDWTLKLMGDKLKKSIIDNFKNCSYAQSWTDNKFETDAL
jgi:hypothetical protein